MPNINLVATRREEKRNITTLSRQLFLGLVASGGILLLTLGVFLGVGKKQADIIRELDIKLGELQPKLDKIKQRDADIAALKPRVDTLDNARLSTLRWRTFLSVLAEATPNTVYYTSVSTGGDAANPSVTLKGIAPTQNIVGEVSQRLYKDGKSLFSDVETPTTTNNSTLEDPVQKVAFDMNLYLRPVALAGAPAPSPSPSPVGTPSGTTTAPATGVAASAAHP